LSLFKHLRETGSLLGRLSGLRTAFPRKPSPRRVALRCAAIPPGARPVMRANEKGFGKREQPAVSMHRTNIEHNGSAVKKEFVSRAQGAPTETAKRGSGLGATSARRARRRAIVNAVGLKSTRRPRARRSEVWLASFRKCRGNNIL
jgi:hypothetical protein